MIDTNELRKKSLTFVERALIDEIDRLRARVGELEAARIAYASEFPFNDEGEPDVGSIHANIRNLKKELKVRVASLEHQLASRGGVPILRSYSGLIADAIELISYIDADSHNPPTVKWARQVESKLRAMHAAAAAPSPEGQEAGPMGGPWHEHFLPAPAEGQAEQADCKYPSCACVGGTTSTCATPPPASAMAGVTEALANLCEEIDRHAIATPIMSTNIMWFKRLALEALAAQHQEKGNE